MNSRYVEFKKRHVELINLRWLRPVSVKKNHTDLQISTKSAYKQNIFLLNTQFLAFSLVQGNLPPKVQSLIKKSDLRSKSQIRVIKIKKLKFIDDFMFRKIMENKSSACINQPVAALHLICQVAMCFFTLGNIFYKFYHVKNNILFQGSVIFYFLHAWSTYKG